MSDELNYSNGGGYVAVGVGAAVLAVGFGRLGVAMIAVGIVVLGINAIAGAWMEDRDP